MQGITPEMARAEIARRQSMSMPAAANASPAPGGITKEMAQAELARRQNESRGTSWTESPFMAGVTAFNAGAGKVAHGALQPLLEGKGLLSDTFLGEDEKTLQNRKRMSENMAQKREEEYKNALNIAPNAASIAEMAGEIVGSSPTWAIGGLGKNAIMRILSQGALQGGAMGAGQYVKGNEGMERIKNALTGSAFGAASYPVMRGLGAANPYVKAGTGALLGGAGAMAAGVEDPYKEAAAIAGGAAAPFVPGLAKNALSNVYGRAKSALTGAPFEVARSPMQDVVARDMLAQVKPEEAMARKAASERLGLSYLTPAEASGSPIAGAAQGNVGKTKEGGQMLYEKGQERLGTERKAIKDLFHDIYPKTAKIKAKEQELYTQAHQAKVNAEEVKTLAQDPVIAHAMENVVKKPAFAKDLAGVEPGSLKYLDYTKKYLADMIGKAQRAGENNEVRLLTDSQQKLLATLDNASPEYKAAREIASRRLTRNEFEKALNDKDIRGTNFYQKLLRNDKKFDQLREKVADIPGAQQKLDDMRLVFQDLINPPTARTSAGLAKTKMTNARSTKEAVVDKAKELLGGKYDKAAVNLITSPKWDKEFAAIAKTENKDKRALKATDLLAKIATSIGTNKTAEQQ